MAKKRTKPYRFWGGFTDGTLAYMLVDTGFGGFGQPGGKRGVPALFLRRRDARREYKDVRPVLIPLPTDGGQNE